MKKKYSQTFLEPQMVSCIEGPEQEVNDLL